VVEERKNHFARLDSVQVEERKTGFALEEHMNCSGHGEKASLFVQEARERMEQERMSESDWKPLAWMLSDVLVLTETPSGVHSIVSAASLAMWEAVLAIQTRKVVVPWHSTYLSCW
jgi:hypothetical protein